MFLLSPCEVDMGFSTGYFDSQTHYVGWFEGTRQQIEDAIGAPTYLSNDPREKVTIEWGIQFDDGTTATIYDWKRYSQKPLGLDEKYRWHIGGTGLKAVRKVSQVLGIPATGSELVSY